MANDRRTGAPTQSASNTPTTTAGADVAAFVALAKSRTPAQRGARGRLIFALDATMSRQPTWDAACKLQAEMFAETASTGGLDIQLVYYRGLSECRASRYFSDARQLAGAMEKIDCRGGTTQIAKVLSHARRESESSKVQALVFVGDAMEEARDALCTRAGELGLIGVPAFVFQEGDDPIAMQAFKDIARLTRGAYCRFSPGAAHELAELLRAVAAYAAGGIKALDDLSVGHHAGATRLLQQLR